ncbi:MAG: hypothetical protein KJP11_11635, partial [Gammaproteobacteria bacterium]|nr:hypothetical protein [Gammaproteobacteria bacterium]
MVALSTALLVAACTNLGFGPSLDNSQTLSTATPVTSTDITASQSPRIAADNPDSYAAARPELDYSALDFEAELQLVQAEKALATQAMATQA